MHWYPCALSEFSLPSLEGEQVHVWAWSLDRDVTADDYSTLSADELSDLAKFRFEADHNKYLASHSNTRRILSSYLGCSPSAIEFKRGIYGKPSLQPQRHQLQFNLSHSHSTGLLAIAHDTQLGIDVEDIHPIEEGVCEAFFSRSEQLELGTLRGLDWLSGFFRCWTRKEAILKAEGTGLNIRLDSFDVSLVRDAPAELLRHRSGSMLTRHWVLHHLEPGPGVIGALATDRPASIRCFHLVSNANVPQP